MHSPSIVLSLCRSRHSLCWFRSHVCVTFLALQAVLAVAEHQAATADPRYPVGRTRVAEMSVIWCAIIMFVSTVLVIRESVGALVQGFLHGGLRGAFIKCKVITNSATEGSCTTLHARGARVAIVSAHLLDILACPHVSAQCCADHLRISPACTAYCFIPLEPTLQPCLHVTS